VLFIKSEIIPDFFLEIYQGFYHPMNHQNIIPFNLHYYYSKSSELTKSRLISFSSNKYGFPPINN